MRFALCNASLCRIGVDLSVEVSLIKLFPVVTVKSINTHYLSNTSRTSSDDYFIVCVLGRKPGRAVVSIFMNRAVKIN